MHFKLSSQLVKKNPELNVAVIVLKNLQNRRKSSVVDQLLRGAYAQKRNEFQDKKKRNDFFSILETFTKAPELLPEAVNLQNYLEIAMKDKFLEKKTNLASLLHFFGIKYLLPFGGADLDALDRDIEVQLQSEKYSMIDEYFTPDTVHAALWFVNPGFYNEEEFTAILHACLQNLQQYCHAEAVVHLLSSQNLQVDLEYKSELEKVRLEHEEEQQRLAAEKALREQEEERQRELEALKRQAATQKELESFLTNKQRIEEVLRITLEQWFAGQPQEVQQLLEGEVSQKLALQTPQDPEHGDYATPIALKLAKKLQKDPLEVAESIAKIFPSVAMIEKVEVAKPGFINLYLSQTYLMEQLRSMLKQGQEFGQLNLGKGKKILIEYSSPNIAKPLGVHHLLSTVIGQALVHLYRFAGYDVVALNYLGDWGTQFGKLLYAYKQWGKEEVVMKNPLQELLQLYVRFHREVEKDSSLEDKGREEFKKLEEGDEENTKLWTWMKELSVAELEKLYKVLGVSFDEYLGERMYLEKAKELIAEGKAKGIIEQGEEGAWIVRFENDMYPPYILEKGDGTTIYATRDLASIQDRIARYHPEQIMYVVGDTQKLHFQQLFATAEKFGFNASKLIHVAFGRMALPEGKMSTRKGEVILLEELIAEAQRRTQKIVSEKSADLPELEQNVLAENMAVGAILYSILSQNRETNITFDWDRMLALDGNSAPYLQYTYARANSILRKASEAAEPLETTPVEEDSPHHNQISLFENEVLETVSVSTFQPSPSVLDGAQLLDQPLEIELLRLLSRFTEQIELAVLENKPHLLTNYLYDVAKVFNSFYHEVPVLTAPTEEQKAARLNLVKATAQLLETGLGLLGIKVFERM